MEIKKFVDLPLHDLGHSVQIAGIILQGPKETYNLFFPRALVEAPTLVKLAEDDWKTFLRQVDTQECILFPNKPGSKEVIRKSTRMIESTINWNVFRRDSYTCRYCAANDVPMTIDHVVLWEDMGATVEDNLITACSKCNRTRGNMMYEDWLKSEYYKRVSINISSMHRLANETAWATASKIPVRMSKRNR